MFLKNRTLIFCRHLFTVFAQLCGNGVIFCRHLFTVFGNGVMQACFEIDRRIIVKGIHLQINVKTCEIDMQQMSSRCQCIIQLRNCWKLPHIFVHKAQRNEWNEYNYLTYHKYGKRNEQRERQTNC